MNKISIDLLHLMECPNEEFLIAAYCNLLGRMPDSVGVRHYAKRLAHGTPREVVLAEIRSSGPGREHAISARSSQLEKITTRYLKVRNLPLGDRRWGLLPRHNFNVPASESFDWQAWAEAYLAKEFPAARSNRIAGETRAASERHMHHLAPIGFWKFLGLPEETFLRYASILLFGHELDEDAQLAALRRLLEGTRRLQLLSEWYASTAALEYRQKSAYTERLPWQKNLEKDLAIELKGYVNDPLPVVESPDGSVDYAAWLKRFETLSRAERKALATRISQWEIRPTFSVLVPITNNVAEVEATLQSIQQQIYPDWEIIVSGQKPTLDALAQSEQITHLEVSRCAEGELTGALNASLAVAKGEYVLCLHPGDRLNETALFWFVEALQSNPGAQLLYSDEDRIDATGQRVDPFCKPDYNLELHLCQDLLGRAAAYNAEVLRGIGGFHSDTGTAVYWDAALRIKETAASIEHVSRFSVHVRSDEHRIFGISDADAETGRRVVQSHLERQNIQATVVAAPELPQCNRIKYALPDPAPSVCIIIPTKDKADLLLTCVRSIQEKTDYPNYEIILVDNGSKESDALALLSELGEQPSIRILYMDIPFNWSALNNAAVVETDADLLCFLNNDTEVISAEWIADLVGQACQDGVGIVGARLWYPNNTIQHAGVITGIHGVADHVFRGSRKGDVGYFGRSVLQQSISSVTGACIILQRRMFEIVNKFDEAFPVTLSDIDICLKLVERGFRNIFNPYVELIHHESLSRGHDGDPGQQGRDAYEIVTFIRKWEKRLYKDPAYNLQLSFYANDFRLGFFCAQTRAGKPCIQNVEQFLNLFFEHINQKKHIAYEFAVSQYSKLESEKIRLLKQINQVEKSNIEIRKLVLQVNDDLKALIDNPTSVKSLPIFQEVKKRIKYIEELTEPHVAYLTGKNIRLIAANELRRNEERTASWYSLGNDPHFHVEPPKGKFLLHQGWWRWQVRMQLEQNRTVAKLYFDTGEDFNEDNCVKAVVDNDQISDRIFFINNPAIRLRFDPKEMTGAFSIKFFSLEPVDEDYARDCMLKRLMERISVIDPERTRETVWEEMKSEAEPLKCAPIELLRSRYDETADNSLVAYKEWIDTVERSSIPTFHEMKKYIAEMDDIPLISIVMPVYNTDESYLRKCIESVLNQSYQNWELCIADDYSSDPIIKKVLQEYQNKDDRIRVIYRRENGHISVASNSALALSSGEWVALLDHDDLLPHYALYFIVVQINKTPLAQIIYSDEDKINWSNNRFEPNFKSDWNPDLFYSQNYVSHLGVYRKGLLVRIGGFRQGVEGSQDQDLLLRCLPYVQPFEIIHIPRILYHWRSIEGSTAMDSGEKSYTTEAGVRALRDYFDACGLEQVGVEASVVPNTYRLRWPIPKPGPLVSLLIPTRDKKTITEIAVQSILKKTTYQNYEIIILDNCSKEQETIEWFSSIQECDSRVRVIGYDHPFNYSAINNFGVKQSKGEIVGLINNDVEVISPGWLDEMVSHALRPDIGCVGAKLYYGNGTLQHGGVIVGLCGLAGHSHRRFPGNHPGYFARLVTVQNLSAVTAACLLVRRSIYEEVHGLDEVNLKVAFNDVDFCLKVREAGYRNLWTPYAELYHHESLSRGKEDTPEKQARFQREIDFMRQKWGNILKSDPFYNQNLTADREDFSLG